MANPMYGGNKFDSQLNQGYLDFIAGYQGNLTATGITVTAAIEAAALAAGSAADILAGTLVANAVNHMNSAHSEAGCVFLPNAVAGAHLVCDYTQSPDEHASAHSFKCAGGTGAGAGAVFAKQTHGTPVGENVATCIETGGTNLLPTSVQLIYTPAAAATNTLGTGSMIHFYCIKDGEWLVKMELINQTTGVTGVWTVA
tara:strand:+ start:105 stop:701 length:597 start_codon:yes stop_codon:yes gene_type:complete